MTGVAVILLLALASSCRFSAPFDQVLADLQQAHSKLTNHPGELS